MSMVGDYEQQQAELEQQFSGWEIWASPYGNPVTTNVTWTAHPLPKIITDSPEDLAERIRAAHSRPPAGNPVLASWRSYRARLRQFRQFEEAAGAAWQRMRAQPRRRRPTPVSQVAVRSSQGGPDGAD